MGTSATHSIMTVFIMFHKHISATICIFIFVLLDRNRDDALNNLLMMMMMGYYLFQNLFSTIVALKRF